jgi:hypothetical protein
MHRIAFAQTALRSRVQATPRLRSISHNSFVGDTINIRANQHKSHRLYPRSDDPQRKIIPPQCTSRPSRR